MTVDEIATVAQTVVAVAAIAGILVSLWSANSTLREVQRDRRARQAPMPLFETGPYQVPILFRSFEHRIPGVNPVSVEDTFQSIALDAKVVDVDIEAHGSGYGRLLNVGFGPALEVLVEWKPESVGIGSEDFYIDASKYSEPTYTHELNTMPTVPRVVGAGQESELTRLPTFVVLDSDRKVKHVAGRLIIRSTDVAGRRYKVVQEFKIFTHYATGTPTVWVVFGDVLEPAEMEV